MQAFTEKEVMSVIGRELGRLLQMVCNTYMSITLTFSEVFFCFYFSQNKPLQNIHLSYSITQKLQSCLLHFTSDKFIICG